MVVVVVLAVMVVVVEVEAGAVTRGSVVVLAEVCGTDAIASTAADVGIAVASWLRATTAGAAFEAHAHSSNNAACVTVAAHLHRPTTAVRLPSGAP